MTKTLSEKIKELKRKRNGKRNGDIVLKVMFDSLTPEQKQEIRGERGERGPALRFDDLTTVQKDELRSREPGQQGCKGDTGPDGPPGPALRFENLTQEQKRELKGEKGEEGPPADEKGIFERLGAKITGAVNEAIRKAFTDREKELVEYLRKEMARIAQAMQRQMGGGLNRQAVLDLISGNGNFTREDLSSQCNGSLKIFVLANSYTAGSVQLMSTQFPIVYRPTTDFTESADKEITLTAEVGAPQTGQTLVAIYEKSV